MLWCSPSQKVASVDNSSGGGGDGSGGGDGGDGLCGGGDLCLGSGDLMSKIFLVLLILRDLRANAVDRAVSPPWAEGSESKEM